MFNRHRLLKFTRRSQDYHLDIASDGSRNENYLHIKKTNPFGLDTHRETVLSWIFSRNVNVHHKIKTHNDLLLEEPLDQYPMMTFCVTFFRYVLPFFQGISVPLLSTPKLQTVFFSWICSLNWNEVLSTATLFHANGHLKPPLQINLLLSTPFCSLFLLHSSNPFRRLSFETDHSIIFLVISETLWENKLS